MMDIGIKVKELRLENNLTQRELSQKIHIAQNTLSQIENNVANPSYEVLNLIADFFQCSTDYLLGREDDFGNITIKSEKPADLSDDELTLIEKYRRLQTGYQVLIGNQIQVLLDHQKKSELPAQQEYGSQKKPNSKSK